MKSCFDRRSELMTKLRWERSNAPFRDYNLDSAAPSDGQACFVYIRDFTMDGIDFAYYIRGAAHRTSFLSGTFGMQAYNGAMLATPVILYRRSELLLCQGVNLLQPGSHRHCRVTKHGAEIEKLRWRYLYETARLAWSELVFDPKRYDMVKRRVSLAQTGGKTVQCAGSSDEDEEMEREDPGADWDISSVTSDEAQAVKTGAKYQPPQKANGKGVVKSSDHVYHNKINVREILNGIERSEGKVNDLLSYIAPRTSHGQPLATEGQKRLVSSLSDAMDLIGDLRQERHGAGTIAAEIPPDVSEMESELEEEKDLYLAQLQEILNETSTMPKSKATIDMGNGKDMDTLTEDKKDALETIMAVTNQSRAISLGWLRRNSWDLEKAIDCWFDVGVLESEAGSATGNDDFFSNNDDLVAPTVFGPSASTGQVSNTAGSLLADRARLERLISESQQNSRKTSEASRSVKSSGHRSSSNNSEGITKMKASSRYPKSPARIELNGTYTATLDSSSTPGVIDRRNPTDEPNQVEYIRAGTTLPSQTQLDYFELNYHATPVSSLPSSLRSRNRTQSNEEHKGMDLNKALIKIEQDRRDSGASPAAASQTWQDTGQQHVLERQNIQRRVNPPRRKRRWNSLAEAEEGAAVDVDVGDSTETCEAGKSADKSEGHAHTDEEVKGKRTRRSSRKSKG